jgi:glucokinase
MATIGALDVGGTNIKSGRVTGRTVELCPTIAARSREPAEIVLGQLAAAVRGLGSVDRIAIAMPGPFDHAAGVSRMHDVSKFEAIYGIPLAPELRRRAGLGDEPIVFVHDAEAAGVGEAVAGAGAGFRRVLTITLGTGVGSCLTDGGVPVRRVGDLSVDELAMRPTPHGRADDVLSVRGLATLAGADRSKLVDVLAGARGDDILAEYGRRIEDFLAPTVVELDAEVVVFGGGAAASYDRFAVQLSFPHRRATLGAEGPLLGAALLTEPSA